MQVCAHTCVCFMCEDVCVQNNSLTCDNHHFKLRHRRRVPVYVCTCVCAWRISHIARPFLIHFVAMSFSYVLQTAVSCDVGSLFAARSGSVGFLIAALR